MEKFTIAFILLICTFNARSISQESREKNIATAEFHTGVDGATDRDIKNALKSVDDSKTNLVERYSAFDHSMHWEKVKSSDNSDSDSNGSTEINTDNSVPTPDSDAEILDSLESDSDDSYDPSESDIQEDTKDISKSGDSKTILMERYFTFDNHMHMKKEKSSDNSDSESAKPDADTSVPTPDSDAVMSDEENFQEDAKDLSKSGDSKTTLVERYFTFDNHMHLKREKSSDNSDLESSKPDSNGSSEVDSDASVPTPDSDSGTLVERYFTYDNSMHVKKEKSPDAVMPNEENMQEDIKDILKSGDSKTALVERYFTFDNHMHLKKEKSDEETQDRCPAGYYEDELSANNPANFWHCCESCPSMKGVTQYNTCNNKCACICRKSVSFKQDESVGVIQGIDDPLMWSKSSNYTYYRRFELPVAEKFQNSSDNVFKYMMLIFVGLSSFFIGKYLGNKYYLDRTEIVVGLLEP